LGQLIMSVSNFKADFYNDSKGFINSYNRSDMGLHLATGLTFGGHLRIGARVHIGFSNIANSTGIVKPTCHARFSRVDRMAVLKADQPIRSRKMSSDSVMTCSVAERSINGLPGDDSNVKLM
ncbi:hypothetical protein, partial [uncultured Duncaniella sp.]|uniref:hypothetical protein n=1 Tax=uncultured Duncaniella sp. TaxID=2768039 RepID=UPI002731D5B4